MKSKSGDKGVAACNERPAAKRLWSQKDARPRTEAGNGKFGGLPGGPSGGQMNSGGKKRPGHNARYGID
jgi:hypothetical protein